MSLLNFQEYSIHVTKIVIHIKGICQPAIFETRFARANSYYLTHYSVNLHCQSLGISGGLPENVHHLRTPDYISGRFR